MKALPIGISTFSKVIREDYAYVDKTGYIRTLADKGKYYFLARPRRFGKSLFLSTLEEAFSGNRELFHGLSLEASWSWNTPFPVVSLSFGGSVVRSREELAANIGEILSEQAGFHGVALENETLNGRFRELLVKLSRRSSRRVVVLIDEYDKPILDNITNTREARRIRDELKNLYSVIKDSDAYVEFCFITGVSKFSKVSLFSGLNNLMDISLAPGYGAICGYTEQELESTFGDLLADTDRDLLRTWYNGYGFLGERVYNPFDILLFLDSGRYGNYWFETGTPTFLIDLLRKNQFYMPDLEHFETGEEILNSFEVEDIRPETLLFQSGYLTIDREFEEIPGFRSYTLRYPNLEVRTSLNTRLLNALSPEPAKTGGMRRNLTRALLKRDMEKVHHTLHGLFASIPHQWYTDNNIERYEGFYASVVYTCFSSLGFMTRAEESGNVGRADLIVETHDTVYIIEFKVTEMTGDGMAALAQIEDRGYQARYEASEKNVILLGIDFSKKERNIVGFAWKQVAGEYVVSR
ncbi:MAG TPA: AAA family ATPase [Desulfomicrobiaceae bacterium]|nr:AAA family ATPase [Desulfomicrobiaceae bacterium]